MTAQTVKSALGHMMGQKHRIRATWVISPTNVQWSLLHLGTVGLHGFICRRLPNEGKEPESRSRDRSCDYS